MSRRKLDDFLGEYDDESSENKQHKRLRKLSDLDHAEGDDQKQPGPAAELDLTGAAVLTDRLDIPDTTIADGIDNQRLHKPQGHQRRPSPSTSQTT